MRILVNAGTLRGAGSERVGRGLLGEFSARPGPHNYLAHLPREWAWTESPGFQVRETSPGIGQKFLLETVAIPRQLRGPYDALLSLGDTSTPRPGKPHCLFVQQAYLAYPEEQWGFEPPTRFLRKMQLMALYFRAGVGAVNRFVVQTRDMKEKLCRRWALADDRVSVIPSAVGDDVLVEAQKPHVEAGQPQLLYVAGPAPHKNHELLPAVLAALRERNAVLSVTIHRGDLLAFDRAIAHHGVERRVRYLGYINRTEMFNQLRRAHIAVIPSRLESFGLGYYEALAMGLPVVAADLGFAREACGNAALYAAPDDPHAFAANVDDLLASSIRRRDLSTAGRLRFQENALSWSDVAQAFLHELKSCT